MKNSPFISSRPVRGDEFVNRENEIDIILGRTVNGESTIVVGGPKSGKTSLLLKLIEIGNNKENFQPETPSLKLIFLDARQIRDPDDIWRTLWKNTPSSEVNLETGQITRFVLERELEVLASQNTILCLIIDDFDLLFSNPNFKDPVFFASLRSLTTRTGALINIFTSQLRAEELNNAGSTLLSVGSPFFNHMIEVEVETFSEENLEKVLRRSEELFSEEKRKLIYDLAGSNLYLLQAVSASMHMLQGDRIMDVLEQAFKDVSYFFDSLWESLNDDTKNLVTMLGVSQINEVVHKTPIFFSEFQSSSAELTLKRLVKMGLVRIIQDAPNGNSLRLSSLLYVWWLRNNILSGSRNIPSFDANSKSKLVTKETDTINSFVMSALNRV